MGRGSSGEGGGEGLRGCIKGFVPLSWGTFLASCAASFWFDLPHALCNAVLLFAPAPAIFTRRRRDGGVAGKAG